MPLIADIELERQRRQDELDGAKSQLERNRLGQFATPEPLALDMAQLAWNLWSPKSARVRFLDPGIGLGSFYSAMRRVFPADALVSAVGIERDPGFARAARDLWGPAGLTVAEADFTRTTPPSERASLILANPPYVRHHHLAAEEKARLQQAVADSLGISVNGLAGLYVYFMLLCDQWMEEGGLALWLLPSEFLDVNYGQAVRAYLRDKVTLLRLHRFDPDDVQFSDALVSSAVVVFRKAKPPADHSVVFTYGGSLVGPRSRLCVRLNELDPASKWSGHSRTDRRPHQDISIRLGDLFAIKRGLATGANEVFIVSRDRARQLRLPEEYLRPILPSPRNLKTTVIEAGGDGYPLLPDQLALVDCPLPEDRLQDECPDLFDYLYSPEADRIRGRYLLKKRTPWYRQEQRPAAPFLCTYMGRGVGDKRPFRFIWNKSSATAANVYLLLYPKGAMNRALCRVPALYAAVYDLFRRIGADDLRDQGRVYGGALHKLEPSELGNLPADEFLATIQAHVHVAQGDLFSDSFDETARPPREARGQS